MAHCERVPGAAAGDGRVRPGLPGDQPHHPQEHPLGQQQHLLHTSGQHQHFLPAGCHNMYLFQNFAL